MRQELPVLNGADIDLQVGEVPQGSALHRDEVLGLIINEYEPHASLEGRNGICTGGVLERVRTACSGETKTRHLITFWVMHLFFMSAIDG